MTTCTRCEGSGFLNLVQVSEEAMHELCLTGDLGVILRWIKANDDHDVSVCDCCGDGENWHGSPGEHYGSQDPPGPNGPYAYNGGLCECH